MPRGKPATPRTRTTPLTYEECAVVFNRPIADAVNILGVSRPTISKVLRRHGIPRWPYRKLKAYRCLSSWDPSSHSAQHVLHQVVRGGRTTIVCCPHTLPSPSLPSSPSSRQTLPKSSPLSHISQSLPIPSVQPPIEHNGLPTSTSAPPSHPSFTPPITPPTTFAVPPVPQEYSPESELFLSPTHSPLDLQTPELTEHEILNVTDIHNQYTATFENEERGMIALPPMSAQPSHDSQLPQTIDLQQYYAANSVDRDHTVYTVGAIDAPLADMQHSKHGSISNLRPEPHLRHASSEQGEQQLSLLYDQADRTESDCRRIDQCFDAVDSARETDIYFLNSQTNDNVHTTCTEHIDNMQRIPVSTLVPPRKRSIYDDCDVYSTEQANKQVAGCDRVPIANAAPQVPKNTRTRWATTDDLSWSLGRFVADDVGNVSFNDF